MESTDFYRHQFNRIYNYSHIFQRWNNANSECRSNHSSSRNYESNKNKKYTFTIVSLGAANSTASIQTDTKITAATTTQAVTAAVSQASGSDTISDIATKTIIQFQDQRILSNNTYTQFKSHAEYIRYLKGKTTLSYS